jgi:hypothetical protein
MFVLSATTLAEAAQQLGWDGTVLGPIEFGGARFWAIARGTPADAGGTEPPSVHLAGYLLTGPARTDLVREASLLAAYVPRAVLVDGRRDLTGLLVDAAVLDQGVVVIGPEESRVRLLATAGPRIAHGPLSAREQDLLDRVYSTWQTQQVASVA